MYICTYIHTYIYIYIWYPPPPELSTSLAVNPVCCAVLSTPDSRPLFAHP